MTKQKLTPMRDRVIVKRDEPEKVTKGGILLPETQQKNPPQRGTIIAVGPAKVVDGEAMLFNAEAGSVVYFAPYVGSDVKVEGEDYLILRYDDVLAVLS